MTDITETDYCVLTGDTPGEAPRPPCPRCDGMRETYALVAWAAGELTEGQFHAITGLDIIEARGRLRDAVAVAERQWAEWRAANPPRKVGAP